MQTRTGNGHNAELQRFYDDLKRVVQDGEELLKNGFTSVREQAKVAADKTDQVVRDRPYQTVGIAFGLGIAVGILAAGLMTSGQKSDCDL